MALRKMELTYSASAVQYRMRIHAGEGERAAQEGLPPSGGIMALHALMLCTRSLVGSLREVARDVQALAPPDVGPFEEEGEGEDKSLR